MRQIIELASGQINASDMLLIQLVETEETPPVVLLHWPPSGPSVATPVRFPATASAITPSWPWPWPWPWMAAIRAGEL